MKLDAIRPLLDADGPFVTIHAEVGRASEDAVSQRDARWTTTRHELEKAGVSSALVADIGDRLLANTHLPGDVRRTIVAADDTILMDDLQPGHTTWPEVVEVGPLPQLDSWLAAQDSSCHFLLVNTDRVGADLSLHTAATNPAAVERSVEGDDFYITKVAEGDWAQKQFQQTAENTWQYNARLVADEVVAMCRRNSPEVVLVAGETRARAEVLRALEPHQAGLPTVTEIDAGGRADGASHEALWQQVEEVTGHVIRERDVTLAASLDEARGRGEDATGLDPVLNALAQSQVEHLAVDLAAMADRSVAVERLSAIPLPRSAVEQKSLPADQALVAAAALTGAALTPLPASMSRGGGVSALLRWA